MEIRANAKLKKECDKKFRVVEMWNGEFVVQVYNEHTQSWGTVKDGRFQSKKEALEYADELWERDRDYYLGKQVKKVIKTYG